MPEKFEKKIEKDKKEEITKEEKSAEQKPEETPEDFFAETIQAKEKLDTEVGADLEEAREKLKLLTEPLPQEGELAEAMGQRRITERQLNELVLQKEKQLATIEIENKKIFLFRIFSKRLGEAKEQLGSLNEEIKKTKHQLAEIEMQESRLKAEWQEKEESAFNSIKNILDKTEERYNSIQELLRQNEDLQPILNEQLIAEKIIPNLETLSGIPQEQISEFLNLIRWRLNEKNFHSAFGKTEEEVKQQRKKSSKLYYSPIKLPLQELIDIDANTPNQGYDQIFTLLISNEEYDALQTLSHEIRQKDLTPSLKDKLLFTINQSTAKLEPTDNEIGGVLVGPAASRWNMVKNYPQFKKIFREESFLALKKKIKNQACEYLWQADTPTVKEYWFKMNLINEETLPLLLLAGHMASSETIIKRLLKTPLTIDKLDKKMQEIVSAIQDNPDVFKKQINNPRKKELIEKIRQSDELMESIWKNTWIQKIIFSDQIDAIPEPSEKTHEWTVPLTCQKEFDISAEVKQITAEHPLFYKLLVKIEKEKFPEAKEHLFEISQIKIGERTQTIISEYGRKVTLEITQKDFNDLCKKLELEPTIIAEPDFVENKAYFELQDKFKDYAINILKKDDTPKQIFALKFLQTLDIDLGEVYEVIPAILQKSQSDQLKKELFQFIENKLYIGLIPEPQKTYLLEQLILNKSLFVRNNPAVKDKAVGLIKEMLAIGAESSTLIDELSRQLFSEKFFDKYIDYQRVIRQYKIFYQKIINRPFRLSEMDWYGKLAEIENLEKKLELFQTRYDELVNKLSKEELEQRPNLQSMSKASFLQDQTFKLFITCQADPEKFFNVYYCLDDPYFREGKDAQSVLQKFLQRVATRNYPDEAFIKIMTSSKEAKNIKRLLTKIMVLEDIESVADPSQKINWSFLEENEKYSEIFEKTNKMFIEKAVRLLFSEADEKTKKETRDKIEKLLLEDENFEDDFRVMIDSVGIYAQKYQKESETFNELMRAIRQSLELDFTRDPEEYKQERFKRSKEQFDRIFEQLPNLDKQKIGEKWLDTSLIIKDSLDQTSVAQKQVLKNKLNEVRTTFETEILPDLISLFQEKLKNLQDLIQAGDKKAGLFKARLEIFQQYLVDEKGNLRLDIVEMFRNLAQDIRKGERILKSKEAAPEEKKAISKNLGTIKSLRDTLKGIYKLSAIQPNKLDIKTDYAVEIDEIVDLLSGSLHKLAIVDKEKKATAELGSNLEIDLRDHLNHLQEVIKEEDHPKKIKIQSQFMVDFNNLARCPELTGSCQRLTEVTDHNQAAYSRILDGINELIDLWEVKTITTKHQRLARCFTELAPIKIEDKEPKLAVLFDRIYTHPEYSTFQHKFTENIIKLALERFQDQKEISILFSPAQFSNYQELIKSLAEKYGYRFFEPENIDYFVNESYLRISQGKYYDAHGGIHNTSTSYYDSMGSGYVLEKI